MTNTSWNFSKQDEEYSQKTNAVTTVDVYTLYFRVCIPEAVSPPALIGHWTRKKRRQTTNQEPALQSDVDLEPGY